MKRRRKRRSMHRYRRIPIERSHHLDKALSKSKKKKNERDRERDKSRGETRDPYRPSRKNVEACPCKEENFSDV